MNEIWIPVIGFEDSYECSSEGRVRSRDRYVRRKSGTQILLKSQLLKPKTNQNGYVVVCFCRFGKHHWMLLSRAVFQSFNGKTELQVDHVNNNIQDNRLINLQALSHRDNNIKAKARYQKTSKYPGVYRYTENKWRAQIGHKGKKYGLGYFDTENEAYNAYEKAKLSFV